MNTLIETQAPVPFSTGLVTARFYETWDFYTSQLGFGTLHENDDRVQLVLPSGAQLTILREETDGYPPELIPATSGRGFWLAVEVDDALKEYARLRSAGVEIASILADKAGERTFSVRDPNGVLVFVVERTGRVGAHNVQELAEQGAGEKRW